MGFSQNSAGSKSNSQKENGFLDKNSSYQRPRHRVQWRQQVIKVENQRWQVKTWGLESRNGAGLELSWETERGSSQGLWWLTVVRQKPLWQGTFLSDAVTQLSKLTDEKATPGGSKRDTSLGFAVFFLPPEEESLTIKQCLSPNNVLSLFHGTHLIRRSTKWSITFEKNATHCVFFTIYNVHYYIKGSEKSCSKDSYLTLLTLFNAMFSILIDYGTFF